MAPNRKGFTLIELLVVIAIIAILAAILFPVFAQARAKARQTTCTSNLRQIANAAQMYRQDFDEKAPGWWGGPVTSTGWQPWEATGFVTPTRGGAANTRQPALLTPYLKNDGIKRCPSDATKSWQTTGTAATNATDGTSYPFNPIVAGANPDTMEPAHRYAATAGALPMDPQHRCMMWDANFWHQFKSPQSRQMIMWNGNVRLVSNEAQTQSYIW
jgi:prepilin-type N-terminal cleavage/methylation domain-containing protein